jgi:hypothetical protein
MWNCWCKPHGRFHDGTHFLPNKMEKDVTKFEPFHMHFDQIKCTTSYMKIFSWHKANQFIKDLHSNMKIRYNTFRRWPSSCNLIFWMKLTKLKNELSFGCANHNISHFCILFIWWQRIVIIILSTMCRWRPCTHQDSLVITFNDMYLATTIARVIFYPPNKHWYIVEKLWSWFLVITNVNWIWD